MTINQRVEALRKLMKEGEAVQAFIVPSTDPHLSEYVASHWESRKWVSGFTGSAGTVVVTETEAGLWTDSRYFLQAEEQLKGSGITLYKIGLTETPSIEEFLKTKLKAGDVVAIDGNVYSVSEGKKLKDSLSQNNIILMSTDTDPFDRIWTDRPVLPPNPAFIHELKYAGMDIAQKISLIRKYLIDNYFNGFLVTALDEIAWTLNLRGTDVHCNPVVISYLYIDSEEIHYFIDPSKITPEVKQYLTGFGITLHPYAAIKSFLSQLNSGRVLFEASKTNLAVLLSFSKKCTPANGKSPIALLKAVRNDVEIQGIHRAMERDGVALVKFLMWLEKAVPQGHVTEISVDEKLEKLRSSMELYQGKSFDTIAGYREHGAIVHYEATPESNVTLKPEGFLLLDSGAQYLDGTTDITRTISLGPLTEEQKTDYTLILKGHIDLGKAVFPAGTRGAQLDVLARMPIWQQRMNYLHGTGHGVGHFLNVHEGPQSIRMNENPVVIQTGMLTSNEPGVYKENQYGVRIENLILAVPAGKGMFGEYLRFETLTLCPIDLKPVKKELLDPDEIKWLNEYHQSVYHQLAPYLNKKEQSWLKKATSKI